MYPSVVRAEAEDFSSLFYFKNTVLEKRKPLNQLHIGIYLYGIS